MKIIYMILLLSGLITLVSAEAAIQVNSYSTIPTTLYPGTYGQLQISIANSGTETAKGITIFYKMPSQSDFSQISAGDLGNGANTIVSVPFNVPTSANAGFFTIPIQITYTSQSSGDAKTTSLTIPLEISQTQILDVKTVSVEPQIISPGDKFTTILQISNSGGVIHNLIISSSSSDFVLDGTTQLNVGEIVINQSKNITLSIRSASSASSGKYNVPILITYQDNLQKTISQNLSVGPISVGEVSSQLDVDFVAVKDTEIGSVAEFELSVNNRGTTATSAIININQSSVFTPLGTSHISFDYIEPLSNQSKIVRLGIGSSVSAGYYTLPLEITVNGRTFTQNIGVEVTATPDIRITFDSQPQTITPGSTVKGLIQISNVGNSPIRSLYASANVGSDFIVNGPNDKFIGTLNVDDFANLQLNLDIPGRTSPGSYDIPLQITFKDSRNNPHMYTKTVQIKVGNGIPQISGNAPDPASFRRNNQGGLFGLGLIPTIIGAVVIIIAGYFGYKKIRGKNETKGHP